jgi:hypothetical protein
MDGMQHGTARPQVGGQVDQKWTQVSRRDKLQDRQGEGEVDRLTERSRRQVDRRSVLNAQPAQRLNIERADFTKCRQALADRGMVTEGRQ